MAKLDDKKASHKKSAKHDAVDTMHSSNSMHDGAEQKTKDSSKKERKQQAKRDAKLMLKIEQTKKEVEKAQQKVTKAHEKLAKVQANLNTLQEEMESSKYSASLTTSSLPVSNHDEHVTQNGASSQEATHANEDTTSSMPVNQVESQMPAEGRSDSTQSSQTVPEHDGTHAETPAPTDVQSQLPNLSELPAQDTSITSDNVSMPLVTQDEQAWPPPVIREEVIEAVVEVVESKAHESGSATQTSSSKGENVHTGAGDEPEEQAGETHTTTRSRRSRRAHTDSQEPKHEEHSQPEQQSAEHSDTQLAEHYGAETHPQE